MIVQKSLSCEKNDLILRFRERWLWLSSTPARPRRSSRRHATEVEKFNP